MTREDMDSFDELLEKGRTTKMYGGKPKISEKLVRELMLQTADFLETNPLLFTQKSFALNEVNASSGIFESKTIIRSGDGWFIKFAFDKLKRESAAMHALEQANVLIYDIYEQSMVCISDDHGLKKLVEALRKAAPAE